MPTSPAPDPLDAPTTSINAEIAITWICPNCGAKVDHSYDVGVGYLPLQGCGNAGCPGVPRVARVELTVRREGLGVDA